MTLASLANALLLRVTRASLRHPVLFLIVALALTAVSAALATKLTVRTSFEELLPSDVPSAANAKELARRVGGDGNVFVNVEILDDVPAGGLPAAEKLGKELTADFLAMGPDSIRSIESNVLATRGYFLDHWPLLATTAQLQKALDELNRRVDDEDPFNLHLDDDTPKPSPAPAAAPALKSDDEPAEDDPARWLDGKEKTPREKVEERFARYKDGFIVHPDGKSLLLVVRPAANASSVEGARQLLDRMQAVVDARKAEIGAAHLRVGFAGSFPMFVAETEAVIRDMFSTVGLVVVLVLCSIVLFFRDVRSTLVLGFAVLVAVTVTFGLTRLVIGYLNTQTAFLGSVVIGNGINYGLIYLTRVRQLRRAGVALEPACVDAAPVAAQATLLASAASSVSFGMLILAANRGFSHFGFMGGAGMLLCWVFTFALVPALLALWERVSPVKPDEGRAVTRARARPEGRDAPEAERHAPAWLQRAFARPRLVVFAFSLLAMASIALFVQQIPKAIEYNLENLGNDPLAGKAELVRDHDRANESLDESVAGVLALLPSREAADAFCDAVRERAKSPRYEPVVQGCDTMSSILPMPAQQAERLALVQKIHARLTRRVIAAASPDLRPRLRQVRDELRAQKLLDVSDVPPTLLDKFRERDGALGRLAVVTARQSAHLELGPNLVAFVEGVRDVPALGRRYDATGDNVVFADLLKNIEHEGPITTAGSLLGVCALVLIFFRDVRRSAQIVAALVTGIVLMGGAAALLHLKINFFNFIVFPITFGIAVDYGANIVVRVRERGGDVLGALAEVGPAVALCSWTSMIGYATLLIALNRALRSFGWYAVVGEITSITTALVMLPALALFRQRPLPVNHAHAQPVP